jgi:GNAT superfamily N-acetyltransferase
MYQYIRSIVPTWPEYIVKDWLYANQAKPFGRQSNITPADRSFETLRTFIPELLADIGLTVDTKWQLVPNMKFTMDMWVPKTKQQLIARAGGKPTELVPSTMAPNMKDAERHTTQAALAKQQGGIRKEPVILLKTSQGYELLEGWHRTIQHFARYPDGYTGPAYVAVAQGQSSITEAIAADQVLDYVKQAHAPEAFDIEYSITDHPAWELKTIPLSQLNLDPDGETPDPYNRVNWVDDDKVQELIPRIGSVLKRMPIVVDSEGWIIDGNHRAMAASEAGLTSVPALVPVKTSVAENMDHSQDGRAVEELRAALLAKKDQLQSASDDQVYDIIDKIMTRIARSHSISGQKLHDMWVDRYKQIPDTWIMNEQQGMAEEHADQKRLDPELYEELPTTFLRGIVTRALPDVPLRFKTTPEGYLNVRADDGSVRLDIGMSIAGGDIGFNIENAYLTQHQGTGAMTQIIKDAYQAVERKYGRPQSRSLNVMQDRGHGVWQAIANKVGAEYGAHSKIGESLEAGVTEGSGNNIKYKQQRGKNKFSVEMLVDGKSAGIFQYDANSGRTIVELDPEYRGQGLGQRLILKGIYTAAMMGLDYAEDESRTQAFDNAIDSLADNGYIVNDDEYWYVTDKGEQFLKQGIAENFADGRVKGKSRPGRVARAGASCAGSVTDLRAKARKYGGERGRMYHWCANMKGGKKK